MQYNREIAVVYTVSEALEKLNYMRSLGFFEHELHVITKDIQPFNSLKMSTEIDVHQAGNVLDKFKAMLNGMNVYETSLTRFHLAQEEIKTYAALIAKDAIFIIALHEYPMEKQKQRQTIKMKDFARIPNIGGKQIPTQMHKQR